MIGCAAARVCCLLGSHWLKGRRLCSDWLIGRWQPGSFTAVHGIVWYLAATHIRPSRDCSKSCDRPAPTHWPAGKYYRAIEFMKLSVISSQLTYTAYEASGPIGRACHVTGLCCSHWCSTLFLLLRELIYHVHGFNSVCLPV